jgi:hypothetical protein
MRTGMDRRTILRSHQLENAPRALQELFWRRYNQTTWRARRPASLQELLDSVAKDARLQPAGPLDELKAAWRRIVPEEFQRSTRIEGLSVGRLRVAVDSAATRYVLGRQIGPSLVDALNAAIGLEVVKRIDYRISARTPNAAVEEPPPRRGLKKKLS